MRVGKKTPSLEEQWAEIVAGLKKKQTNFSTYPNFLTIEPGQAFDILKQALKVRKQAESVLAMQAEREQLEQADWSFGGLAIWAAGKVARRVSSKPAEAERAMTSFIANLKSVVEAATAYIDAMFASPRFKSHQDKFESLDDLDAKCTAAVGQILAQDMLNAEEAERKAEQLRRERAAQAEAIARETAEHERALVAQELDRELMKAEDAEYQQRVLDLAEMQEADVQSREMQVEWVRQDLAGLKQECAAYVNLLRPTTVELNSCDLKAELSRLIGKLEQQILVLAKIKVTEETLGATRERLVTCKAAIDELVGDGQVESLKEAGEAALSEQRERQEMEQKQAAEELAAQIEGSKVGIHQLVLECKAACTKSLAAVRALLEEARSAEPVRKHISDAKQEFSEMLETLESCIAAQAAQVESFGEGELPETLPALKRKRVALMTKARRLEKRCAALVTTTRARVEAAQAQLTSALEQVEQVEQRAREEEQRRAKVLAAQAQLDNFKAALTKAVSGKSELVNGCLRNHKGGAAKMRRDVYWIIKGEFTQNEDVSDSDLNTAIENISEVNQPMLQRLNAYMVRQSSFWMFYRSRTTDRSAALFLINALVDRFGLTFKADVTNKGKCRQVTNLFAAKSGVTLNADAVVKYDLKKARAAAAAA